MKKGIIVVSIICIILSGCGNKKDVSDDFANVQVSTTTVDQASEGEAVIEKVNYSIDGKVSGSSLAVDAEVDTRIPDGIQVYNVEEINVTDEYLLSMASNVFDQGKYAEGLAEVTDSIANNVNVVAFSQADANAQKEFIDNFEGNFQVSDIRLEYVVVKYDKETVMVPGWVYYRNNFGGLNYTVFAINALDGSPIFYSYNFYHQAFTPRIIVPTYGS